MAPEYTMGGQFYVKLDVFSFGVLLLEIVSGQKNNAFQEHGESLLTSAWKLWSEGQGLALIDPLIKESCDGVEVLKCIQIGLLCVQEKLEDRPIMSSVVHMLGGDTNSLPRPLLPAFLVGRDVRTLDPIGEEASTVNEATVSDVSPR
ncbi:cysteine-rich receptor-like protein kinase 44 [Syzygium oleosum]|uniref:cysteine-rich receptor-like protein kinase 44 n=1 Tax=Syzygium oleosum TaxID=219896 RepID=UPI0024B8F9A3|nr:cysteine-rich receptor-like protein kinase 44 [Syzygium oleosum]